MIFCLYINDLFDVLCNEEGADPVIIGDQRILSVAYADDVLLMRQSQKELIKQIKTRQTFCLENMLMSLETLTNHKFLILLLTH